MAFSFSRYERRKMYYWSGIFCAVVGILLFALAVTKHMLQNQRDVPAYVGGYCAIFACVMSFFQILEHLSCFTDAECQTKIVRILFMVPLYAMVSWLSILNPSASEYLAILRDTYESYAIYNFFSLMLALMGGVDTLYRTLMIEERPPIPHFFPLCWMEPVKVTPRFIQVCRRCVFQFMVCKPLVSVIILILTLKNRMGDSLLDVTRGYFWTSLVYNVSITIGFTALLYFYTGLKDFMEGKQPLAKFMCIKAVIFLSYWQGIVIAILAASGVLPKFDYWTDAEAPNGLQDLLICIEALFIAFGHKFCFGSEEYAAPDDPDHVDETTAIRGGRFIPAARLSIWSNLKYTLRHEDLWLDFRDIMRNR